MKKIANFTALQSYRVPRSQTVELKINNVGNARFTFPDSSTLRSKNIVGAVVRPQNADGTRKSFSGRTLVSNDALACASLSLNYNGTLVVDTMPIELATPELLKRPYLQLCIPLGYDPQESFVSFSDSTTISEGQSVEITFFYFDDYCENPDCK